MESSLLRIRIRKLWDIQIIHNEYYINQISTNSWIQILSINQDIIFKISAFSVGVIKDCFNDNCNNKVSIGNQYKNIFEQVQSAIDNQKKDHHLDWLKLELLIQVANKYKNEDGVYYHNEERDLSFCGECTKSMKGCNETGFIKDMQRYYIWGCN